VYCNDGDWVENCTSLIETREGVLELLYFADHRDCLHKTGHFSVDPAVDASVRKAS